MERGLRSSCAIWRKRFKTLGNGCNESSDQFRLIQTIFIDFSNDAVQYACDLVNTFPWGELAGMAKRGEKMTDENRKDQDKQEELTEKDLDQASGGAHHGAPAERQRHILEDSHGKK